MVQRGTSSVIGVLLVLTVTRAAVAQTPPLVFTVVTPTPAPPASDQPSVEVRTSAAVAERALALWNGTAADFGVAVDASRAQWTVHYLTSMRRLEVDHGMRPTFQQVEAFRSFASNAHREVIAGGGVRQEWDGTQVLIGRALGGVQAGGGRLQGSFVIEHALSAPVSRDAADVITSVGWSRPVGARLALGMEGIGQDLEGLWDPAEAEGGARLLVGPSIHIESRGSEWSATATVGPVIQTTSTIGGSGARTVSGHHYGFFASATWCPSRR